MAFGRILTRPTVAAHLSDSHARPRRQPVLLRTESRKVGQALSQALLETGLTSFFKNFIPQLDEFLFSDLISSIIGGIVGYGMIWGIIKLYKKLKNIEGMGLGDAKLFCGIGLWFGYQSVFIIIFLASIIALIVIAPKLMMGKIKMKNEIPFGPFIIIGNLVYLIFMDEIFSFLSMTQL